MLSVVFTLIAGESPLEALGIKPLTGTIGTIVLIIVLAVAPGIVKRLRGDAN